jgi:ATP-dependent DNA helicase DinG
MHYDVLELFAFVRPARFCLPTPKGLAHALGLSVPETLEDEAIVLFEAAQLLLRDLTHLSSGQPQIRRIAATMQQGGWPWAEAVLAALGEDRNSDQQDWSNGLDVWNQLDEWQERGLEGDPGTEPVSGDEARVRLSEILGGRREPREAQAAYSALAAECFQPRNEEGEPHLILAEAGTGIGKTAGYIAPASLWAEKNDGAVWISTYTKNLQRQIDQEFSYLFPDPVERNEKVVIRKGRENYLCLLNLQELIGGTGGRGSGSGGTLVRSPIALGFVARWAGATRDGDMVGGDFPAWLTPIITQNPLRVQAQGIQAAGLTDRRGECIYSACPHYRKCFIERGVRKARRAEVVIANHALVMNQAAVDYGAGGKQSGKSAVSTGEVEAPEYGRHIVFDEGHHLFDAADSTFAAHLTGFECLDLRRWIRGPEGGAGRGRGRGLLDRVGDLTGDGEKAEEHLRESIRAATCLAAPGFMARISEQNPSGPAEVFLARIGGQVLARATQPDSAFSLEALPDPLVEGVVDAAQDLAAALKALAHPLNALAQSLAKRLDEEAETLDSSSRMRIEAAMRGLERRAKLLIPAWIQMLQSLGTGTPENFVDWFGI